MTKSTSITIPRSALILPDGATPAEGDTVTFTAEGRLLSLDADHAVVAPGPVEPPAPPDATEADIRRMALEEDGEAAD